MKKLTIITIIILFSFIIVFADTEKKSSETIPNLSKRNVKFYPFSLIVVRMIICLWD